MSIQLSAAEINNRKILAQVHELFKGFSCPESGDEAYVVIASTKAENPVENITQDLFLIADGKIVSASKMFYQLIKTNDTAYQALRTAFLKVVQERQPKIIDQVAKGVEKMNATKK